MYNIAVILAAGNGTRMGIDKSKLLLEIGGKTVIERTVGTFENMAEIDEIIVVCRECDFETFSALLPDDNISFVIGGNTRQESVRNAVETIDECDYIVIHDGARPIISTELINICIEMVKEQKALTVVTKTIDTIKEVENGKIVKTIDRAKLYNTQTPQAFEYDLILEAHKKYEGKNFTDDAGMIEKMKKTVYIIDGSYKNIKITTRSDIALAKIYLEE